MTAFFPNRGDEPGNARQRAYGGEAGDRSIDGSLTVTGLANFASDAFFHGRVTLDSGSIIDVSDTTIYTFADPLLRLNTLFDPSAGPGQYVADAGLAIHRGGGVYPEARLAFSESADRSTNEWRVGVVGSMWRVATLADGISDRHALLWDANAGTVTGHPNLTLGTASITSSIPFLFDLPIGSDASTLRCQSASATAEVETALAVERYAEGAAAASLRLGFRSTTSGGVAYEGVPTVSGERVVVIRASAPDSQRTQLLLDGSLAMGRDAADIALLRTDLARLRVEGVSTVGLKAGVGATDDQLVVSPTAVTLGEGVDLDVGDGAVVGRDVAVEALAAESMTYVLPIDLSPLPPAASAGLTRDGLTFSYASAAATARLKYEVTISFTVSAGDASLGLPLTAYAPINIGGDMANVRNVYGVARLMSSSGIDSVVERVYGLPANDLAIQAPFDLSAELTAAAMAGYHLLSINMIRQVGTWQLLITVETRHPLVHAP